MTGTMIVIMVKEYIFLSTNKNCQAGNIDMVEFGHPKVDRGLPVVNIAMAYDANNEIPLFYEEYPGSIVDVRFRCFTKNTQAVSLMFHS